MDEVFQHDNGNIIPKIHLRFSNHLGFILLILYPPDFACWYIDTRLHKPSDLASIMVGIMASPEVYSELFKWRTHYKYISRETENWCEVCAALNDKTKVGGHTVYQDFRGW